MARTMFTVFENASGWFVGGRGLIGPLPSRERAIDLAEGMAWAVAATGHVAEVRVEHSSWRPTDGGQPRRPSAPHSPRYDEATFSTEHVERSRVQ
jgi:hypothetical protein